MVSALKTRLIVLSLVLGLLAAVASQGQTVPKKGSGHRKRATLTGEIVDMGCFTAHGLRGAIHRDCALKCLAMGVPMGLVTADSTAYILTQNHDRAMAPANFPPPDFYLQCRDWPSFQVEVSGYVWERKGTKFLEVLASKPAPPPDTPVTAP
jgi:hypothetical protein